MKRIRPPGAGSFRKAAGSRAATRFGRPQISVFDVSAAALTLVCAAAGAAALLGAPAEGKVHATGRDELKQVRLTDGSTMTLDASTTVEVSMQPGRRLVELRRGRAHFEVTRDDQRPFSVSFGPRQVVAVGTAFDVARQGERASVVLTRGQGLLESANEQRLMSAGERLIFDRDRVMEDRPDLDSVRAWRRNAGTPEHNEPLSGQ